MKKLSDYKNEEALELWGDLIQPISDIIANEAVKFALKDDNKTIATIAGAILRNCSEETEQILLRIDPTPLNGFNVLPRLLALITEFSNSEEFGSFFGSVAQGNAQNASTGSVTENTADDVK